MNTTVKQWTRMMQDLAQSVLHRNPHLLARSHQAQLETSRSDQEAWQPLPCCYGPVFRQPGHAETSHGEGAIPHLRLRHPDHSDCPVAATHQYPPA